MPIGMGLGPISTNVVHKRKFRWTFILSDNEINSYRITTYNDPGSTGHVCKISARPSLSFQEQRVEHLIEVVNLPAKASWESINITVYDVAGDNYLYKWLLSFYHPALGRVRPIADPFTSNSRPKKNGFLRMLDGHGNTIEYWILEGCWPVSINWGDLDYSQSDLATISFQLRYDRAVMQQLNGGPIIDSL